MTGTRRRLINADLAVKDLGARLLAANQELARLHHELKALQDNHDTLLRMLLAVVREHMDRGVIARVGAVLKVRRNLTVSGGALKADQKDWHLITQPLEAEDIVELRAEYAEPVVEPAPDPQNEKRNEP